MKLLLSTILVFSLFGCAGTSLTSHEHNPLEGATVTTITPSSTTDENMVAIQATIKRIVNEQGITDAYLYWIINDALTKDNRAVYDITITVEIEPEAEVDCQHEGEQYEGKDQA
jgi:hypothetical protein